MTSRDTPDRLDSFRFKNNMCANKCMISLAKLHDRHPRCRAWKAKYFDVFEFGCERSKKWTLDNLKISKKADSEYENNTTVLGFVSIGLIFHTSKSSLHIKIKLKLNKFSSFPFAIIKLNLNLIIWTSS